MFDNLGKTRPTLFQSNRKCTINLWVIRLTGTKVGGSWLVTQRVESKRPTCVSREKKTSDCATVHSGQTNEPRTDVEFACPHSRSANNHTAWLEQDAIDIQMNVSTKPRRNHVNPLNEQQRNEISEI